MSLYGLGNLPLNTVKLHGADDPVLLVSFHSEIYEGCSMSLYGLGNLPLNTVKLHGADDPVLLGADPDEEQPVGSSIGAVVNYLAPGETAVSLKHFDGLGVSLHGPVVHHCLSHHGDHLLIDPLPEDDVILHAE